MTEKKLLCPTKDYEILKDARYQYNKTLTEIEKLEKEVVDLMEEEKLTPENPRILLRNEVIKENYHRKDFLNGIIKKLESSCFVKP